MWGSRSFRVVASVVLMASAATACVHHQPPPLPDPIVTCTSFGGSVSYTPPASNAGVDLVIEALPGASATGCTDHTGSAITSAMIEASFSWPSFVCGPAPAGSQVASGVGRFTWSDGSTSDWSGPLLSDGGSGWLLDLAVTGGRWSGARARVPLHATSSDGDCVNTPVSTATIAATSTFVLRPALPPPLSGIAKVAVGTNHTCALTDARRVKCWGSNAYGQLGDGGVTSIPTNGAASDLPVDVMGVSDAVDVTAGDFSSCALIVDGTVRCWGYGGRGELGQGAFASSSTPVTVSGVGDATAISQGLAHTCVLVPGGSAKCWGYNFWGSLGNDANVDSDVPVDVVGLTGATAIVGGGDSVCALVAAGAAKCWGRNGAGQLGDGTTTDRSTPVDVVGLTGAVQVALGRAFTCARQGSGSVGCWGENGDGQLGNGTHTPSLSPVAVAGLSDAVDLGAGWYHACAARTGGPVDCWGRNLQGQLGNGSFTGSASPVGVVGLTDAGQVRGSFHACAVRTSGGVDCWGANGSGQLGDGSNIGSPLPVAVRS